MRRIRARSAGPRRLGIVMLVGVGILSLASCVADVAPVLEPAIAGNGKATVSWSTPIDRNGSFITSYVVTPYIGSVPQLPSVVNASATAATLTGLVNGTAYRFMVYGINMYGNATAQSELSNSVTPGVGIPSGVTAGYQHSCAPLAGGTIECWGSNLYGQLGNGVFGPPSFTPVPVAGITNATVISAGSEHTCALLVGGTIKCWGYNGYGQLGNGTTTNSSIPRLVTGITDAVAVDSGYNHTCALLAGGALRCWGWGSYGQLGNGTTTSSSTPVAVTGITDATAITPGYLHTCALLTAGTVKCWGNNLSRQLGNGTSTNSSTPLAVTGIADATTVIAGRDHSCATLTGGTVKCWGWNRFGQLGNGTTITPTTPVAVSGITDAVTLAAGNDHSCARETSGVVKCWGYNGEPHEDVDPGMEGQLGNGTTTNSSTPVAVSGIADASAITAGNDHSCALLLGGTLKCWGWGYHGQLGNGTTSNATTPVTVIGL